jgi:hypothetical protein
VQRSLAFARSLQRIDRRPHRFLRISPLFAGGRSTRNGHTERRRNSDDILSVHVVILCLVLLCVIIVFAGEAKQALRTNSGFHSALKAKDLVYLGFFPSVKEPTMYEDDADLIEQVSDDEHGDDAMVEDDEGHDNGERGSGQGQSRGGGRDVADDEPPLEGYERCVEFHSRATNLMGREGEQGLF